MSRLITGTGLLSVSLLLATVTGASASDLSVGIGVGGSNDNIADIDVGVGGDSAADVDADILSSDKGSVVDTDATVGGRDSAADADVEVLSGPDGSSVADVDATVGGSDNLVDAEAEVLSGSDGTSTARVDAQIGGSGASAGAQVGGGSDGDSQSGPSVGSNTADDGDVFNRGTQNAPGRSTGRNAGTSRTVNTDTAGRSVTGMPLIGNGGVMLGTITSSDEDRVCSTPAQYPNRIVCVQLRNTPVLTESGLRVRVSRNSYLNALQ
ncbi:hypothetical protein [Palleronia abyssalis]|uniref:Uncharacterized protein n=1 Tax=Palleronia abyssalis TaxID=1501240 RepID=A0A2R8BZ93_9RHOB|nr:hypothetical protein [Palleronia abyssalis]SPJ25478.1 hypothetical protein PAA8504_03329 [Palleronia abyssalis]